MKVTKKRHKKVCHKKKINYLENDKIHIDSIKKDHKEFIKNNKTILKTQQIFKSKTHVFTEQINKIALKLNGDKRMQSIDSIGAYAYWNKQRLMKK